MLLETAKLIVASAEDMGYEIELRESYSGRGMYGKTTVGIVCDSLGDFVGAVAQAAANLADAETRAMHNDVESNGMSTDDFISDVSAISTDSMGRSMIIY